MHRSPATTAPHRGIGALRRRAASASDDGFVLPLVLLVSLLVMIGTATMLGVVANNAVPASHSQDQETALAAAQAGVQAYVAELNANCTNNLISPCDWPYDTATASGHTLTSGSEGSPTLSGAAYTVIATNPQGFLEHNNDDLRVLSTGCVPDCASPRASTKLLADISGVPNVLRFAYFTNYESIDGDLLQSLYLPRTIPLSAAMDKLVGSTSLLPSATSVTWPGIADGSACNHHWYDGRSTTDTATESATSLPAGVSGPISIAHDCSVTFSKGMGFVGPVYSQDALYLSNGTPGASSGPSFSVPTQCTTAVTTSCEPLPPASSGWSTPTDPTTPYRSFPTIGGSPATAGSVQTSPFSLSLPASATGVTAMCTTVGDVSITFTGATATLSGAPGTCGSTITDLSHETILVNGDAAVSGDLTSGRVSVVTQPNGTSQGDITIPANLTAAGSESPYTGPNEFGENSLQQNTTAGAIALVAANDVVVTHDVTCASGGATVTDFIYCPNDISGLYSSSQAKEVVSASTGVLQDTHPARQYCNTAGDTACGSGSASATCDSSSSVGRTIDAAIFALNGSFRTANFNRGCALGLLDVTGGVYQSHRGPLGQEWEVPSNFSGSARAFSGYRLNLTYESLEYAGLPYVPPLAGATANHPWLVVAVSSPQSSSGGN